MYRVENRAEHGRTLVAARQIQQGETIWEYDGAVASEKLSLAEIDALPADKRERFSTYCWQVTATQWEGVTENEDEDPVNFINHSCEPNMHFDGDDRLVARVVIAEGAALTLDYATCDTVFARIDQCLCGEKTCRGRVTDRDAYDPAIRARYGQHMRSCILNH